MPNKRKKQTKIVDSKFLPHIPRKIIDREASGDDIYTLTNLGDSKVRLQPAADWVADGKEGTKINNKLLEPIERFLGNLRNENGELQDPRGDLITQEAVNDQVKRLDGKTETLDTVINNRITEEVTRLDDRVNEADDEISLVNTRLNLLAEGIPSNAVLQLNSENINLIANTFITPRWNVLLTSHPELLELNDNEIHVHDEGLTTISMSLIINQARILDATIKINLRYNGLNEIREVFVRAGNDPVVADLHFDKVAKHHYSIEFKASHNIVINEVSVIASFGFIGQLATGNIVLTNPELERIDKIRKTQFELNVDMLEALDNVEDLIDKVRTIETTEIVINNLQTNWTEFFFDPKGGILIATLERDISVAGNTSVAILHNLEGARMYSFVGTDERGNFFPITVEFRWGESQDSFFVRRVDNVVTSVVFPTVNTQTSENDVTIGTSSARQISSNHVTSSFNSGTTASSGNISSSGGGTTSRTGGPSHWSHDHNHSHQIPSHSHHIGQHTHQNPHTHSSSHNHSITHVHNSSNTFQVASINNNVGSNFRLNLMRFSFET